MAAILAFVISLWVMEPLINVPPDWTSMVALLAGILLFLSDVGVLSWSDLQRNTGWHVFLLAGGGLALGTGLVDTGAVSRLAGRIVPLARATSLRPFSVPGVPGHSHGHSALLHRFRNRLLPGPASGGPGPLSGPRPGQVCPGGRAVVFPCLPASRQLGSQRCGSGYFKSLDMLRAGVVLMALAVVWVSLVGVAVWPFLESLLR